AWLLVLLKLVTPPLVIIPLPVLPASWSEPPAEPAPLNRSSLDSPPSASGAQNIPSNGVIQVPPWWQLDWAKWAANGALAVWIAGAAGWVVWQGRRTVRFRRRVARAEDAGPEVAAAVRRIASALGIASPPAVKVATGIGSPMLWGWGRSTVVLFPHELLA